MAQLTQAAFLAKYSTIFATNGVGSITGSNLRDFRQDISDSCLFIANFPTPDTFTNEAYDWIDGSASFPILGWQKTLNGTGSAISSSSYGVDTTEKALGVIDFQTGTTNSGYAYIYKAQQFKFALGHTIRLSFRIALQALSDGSDTYTAYLGFWDIIAADFSDSAYFKYTHGTNSGKWQCITTDNGSATTTDSGVTAGTTYSVFTIEVNSAGTSCAFSINGTVVQTHTTNIPTTNPISMTVRIEKSVGTTDRKLSLDWNHLLITRTAAR